MAVDVEELRGYVGASNHADVTTLLTECLEEATALVTKYNVKHGDPDLDDEDFVTSDAPPVIVDRATKEVAADLFHRRNAPHGIANQQFATADGMAATPIRIARDPLLPAYKILGRWVGFL